MITYRTQSGSVYDVEGDMVRRRVRSEKSNSERVSGEWKKAQVDWSGIGTSLIIIWGFGKDEQSDSSKTIIIGDEDTAVARMRTTITSPVVGVDEPQCACLQS